MGIVYFIVYLCVGYILMNAMLNFSSDDLDTAEAIAAYTVVVLFWPFAMASIAIICIMDYFGGNHGRFG